jgi:hypothetical protein
VSKAPITEAEVARLLREHWDPIGLGVMPELPADEYAAYAPKVVAIIEKTMRRYGDEKLSITSALTAHAHIASYLTWARTTRIELRGEEACARDVDAASRIVTAALNVGLGR